MQSRARHAALELVCRLSAPLFVLLWSACGGGFRAPPQRVAVGLALKSSGGLPPAFAQGEGESRRVGRLSRVRISGVVSVGAVPIAVLSQAELPLSQAWQPLARPLLERGEYHQVSLALFAVGLDGTWDGADFHLEVKQAASRQIPLGAAWQVKLGQESSVSLVADPVSWITGPDGRQLVDPKDEGATSGLADRLLGSLSVVRDDNQDGIDDRALP